MSRTTDPDENADENADELAGRIAELAGARGLRVVTAESLTSGAIAVRLGAAPDAADWFAGGLVAYQEDVKFGVLGVDEGPVVAQRCADQMADGVRRLLGADLAVAVTGVGGPGPSEGHPAGTVFLSVATAAGPTGQEHHFDGAPASVVDQTCEAALGLLARILDDA